MVKYTANQMIEALGDGMKWEDRFTPYGMQIVYMLPNGSTKEDAEAALINAPRTGEDFSVVPYWSNGGYWLWAIVARY